VWSRLVALYEKLGLLVIASLVALLSGAILHYFSRLPAHYTWLEPLHVMEQVLRLRGFPVATLVVYATGRFAGRGDWNAEATLRRLTAKLTRAEKLLLVRRLATATVVLIAGTRALNLGSSVFIDTLDVDWKQVADQAALFLIGWQLGGWSPSRKTLRILLGQALVALIVFTAVCYSYTVVKALVLVSRAPIDPWIIAAEEALFGVPPHRALAIWSAQYPAFIKLCDQVYFRLFHHMLLTTVLLIGLRLPRERTQYIGALAVCYLLGAPLYHLGPSMGPMYWEAGTYARLLDSPLMTNGIARALLHNTEGVRHGTATELTTWAYIACLPSLHIAHEVVMLWYARHSRIALLASAAFTGLTLLAVMVLGWHYFLDTVAGVLLAACAILLVRWQRDRLMPGCLTGEPDLPLQPPNQF
jgi:hypothetical protein